jgi:plasmid maintenance system antidote protein VapI
MCRLADAAAKMGLSPSTLKATIKGRQHAAEAVAESFAAFTGMSAQFWIGLQANYDEWHRRRTAKI